MIDIHKLYEDTIDGVVGAVQRGDIEAANKYAAEGKQKILRAISDYNIGVAEQAGRRARMNEHHVISQLLTREDTQALAPETILRLKARFAEIKDQKS